MARKKSSGKKSPEASVLEYRHEEAKRKNIPPAGLAAQGVLKEKPKIKYTYDPHRPPVLRFDPKGQADQIPELLQIAKTRPLTPDEAQLLAEALRIHEPWLEWAGKQEKRGFEVDPVALHIHERIATQAILKVIAREDVQRNLFADPQLEYHKAVQFYQHDVDWSNRMILGDSLQVAASLARREDLAGKVQMIYFDPPYGIKFSSNFQPEIGKRDVKDKESDLTREPEMVKAYRDTWTLGVHSYLAYLRDRLYLYKELLTDSGSIFVQISDENLHRVRSIMDEVFGADNFVNVIIFLKTSSQTSKYLPPANDFLLWYAKDLNKLRYRSVFKDRDKGYTDAAYNYLEYQNSNVKKLKQTEIEDELTLTQGVRFRIDNLTSQSGPGDTPENRFAWNGITYRLKSGSWKTSIDGLNRLAWQNRLWFLDNTVYYKRYLNDFPIQPINNVWADTSISGYASDKIYVVQTLPKVIERCLLMTTDPGDLVLDPTCGSGTTAYVAEQWGRRWITIDTSRVALALARQRLLTASFPYYKLRSISPEDQKRNPNGTWLSDPQQSLSGKCTFDSKKVPHITLKSIAQNVALDAIFARHQPILDEKLAALNKALKKVTQQIRQQLLAKLMDKERAEGKKSITDADRRRWQLPKEGWKEWEVPFDTDEDWPQELTKALTTYRAAWQSKITEVNACIQANAEQQELVDQPEVVRSVVRVSGPFTMEAVMPIEESLMEESPIGGAPEKMETFDGQDSKGISEEPVNAEAYLEKMTRLLRADGVRFPDNKTMKFIRLESCASAYFHAEGEWETEDGQKRLVAVSFGPQFGPVTAYQVEQALPLASRRGFNDLVFAGFSFDAAAQAIIQDDPNPHVRCHLAHIRPDVNMGDLLKETPNSQLFTVFGSPRTELKTNKDGTFVVEMQGVDIYNPVDNTIHPTRADKVAAWFLDTDYDGRTFCITQAFLPDKTAWGKIARALKGVIDEEGFAALSGTVSLPFPAGKHHQVAVKVIDPRGNEVMRVHRLPEAGGVRYEK
jgi:adenine-specific DNA-methyltransferase